MSLQNQILIWLNVTETQEEQMNYSCLERTFMGKKPSPRMLTFFKEISLVKQYPGVSQVVGDVFHGDQQPVGVRQSR